VINIVHNCDCMEIMEELPENYFDLAIVDPPYGIGDFNQTRSRKVHKKIKWNNTQPDNYYFSELHRISKNQIIWGANYYGINGGRIIHDKTGGGKRKGPKELSDADIAFHSFGVNIKIFRYLWQGNVQGDKVNWKNTGIDRRIHPCQKPVALYKWILRNYAKPGQKIFDSHVGSGSSRIACYDMGFDFVGCELDKDYWQAQEERFQNYIHTYQIYKGRIPSGLKNDNPDPFGIGV
jgi:site-specific DNA-methyltransferase (adenine-specific)